MNFSENQNINYTEPVDKLSLPTVYDSAEDLTAKAISIIQVLKTNKSVSKALMDEMQFQDISDPIKKAKANFSREEMQHWNFYHQSGVKPIVVWDDLRMELSESQKKSGQMERFRMGLVLLYKDRAITLENAKAWRATHSEFNSLVKAFAKVQGVLNNATSGRKGISVNEFREALTLKRISRNFVTRKIAINRSGFGKTKQLNRTIDDLVRFAKIRLNTLQSI